jgi:beta-D-xylosidase 4
MSLRGKLRPREGCRNAVSAGYIRRVPMTEMSLRPNETSGNPGRTYKWFDGAVQEFGFGLHYTSFSLSLAKKVTESYDIS